jgi:hypothetical protein
MNQRHTLLLVIFVSTALARCSVQDRAPVGRGLTESVAKPGSLETFGAAPVISAGDAPGFVSAAIALPSTPETDRGERHRFPDGSVVFYAEAPAVPAPSSFSGAQPQFETQPLPDTEPLLHVPPKGPTMTDGSISLCAAIAVGTPNICTSHGAGFAPYSCPAAMRPVDGNCLSSGIRTPPGEPRVFCCNPNS